MPSTLQKAPTTISKNGGEATRHGSPAPAPSSIQSAVANLRHRRAAPAAGETGPLEVPAHRVAIKTLSVKIINNCLLKLEYEEDGVRKIGYFKPDGGGRDALAPKMAAIGIDQNNPRFAQRAVAAAIIGRRLIPATLTKTWLITHLGTPGRLQAEAHGELAVERMRRNPTGELKLPKVAASTQTQLADLHVVDHLIGNVDRDLEKYMLEGDKVTAFGGEVSFPSIKHAALRKVPGSTLGALPSGYSATMRAGLRKMDNQWLDENVASLLDDAQMEALKERLALLKHDMENPDKGPNKAAAPPQYLEHAFQ